MLQSVEILRRSPKQQRSGATVDAIFEAAIQILDREGEELLTTNRVAERAGFSVGTLYQYFRNKDALIDALAAREVAIVRQQFKHALSEGGALDIRGVLRILLRIVLRRWDSQKKSNRQAVLFGARRGDQTGTAKALAAAMDALFDDLRQHEQFPKDVSRMRYDVLTRATLGAMRITGIESPEMLRDPQFEEELAAVIAAGLGIPPLNAPHG